MKKVVLKLEPQSERSFKGFLRIIKWILIDTYKISIVQKSIHEIKCPELISRTLEIMPPSAVSFIAHSISVTWLTICHFKNRAASGNIFHKTSIISI